MNLLGIHFIHPWFFTTLLLLLPTVFAVWKKSNTQKTWRDYCDPHLLPHVVSEQKQGQSLWWVWLLTLCIIASSIALAGPSWERASSPVYHKAIARVIVLDLSNSMLANDIPPTRLQRAKYKILDLLRAIDEGQTGMVVFSSEPFVVSPLTDDSNTIAAMVPTLDTTTVPVQGSDIATALIKAAQLLKQGGAERGQIIVFTDSTPSAKAISVSKELAGKGYTTSVVAVGTRRGGPIANGSGGFVTDAQGGIVFAKLDPEALQHLATAGDGQYIAFTDNDADVKQVLQNKLLDTINEKMQRSKHEQVIWHNQGHWFVWAAILFLLLLARRGWLERLLP